MGYSIALADATFKVKPQNVKKINDIIKKYYTDHCNTGCDWCLEVLNYEEMLADSTLGPEIELTYSGEKLYKEDEIFAEIAPYVEAGSWIEIDGEREKWRYYFDGQSCWTVRPKITWEIPPACR